MTYLFVALACVWFGWLIRDVQAQAEKIRRDLPEWFDVFPVDEPPSNVLDVHTP